ncbi:hypothetical protein [Arsenicicoccus dermatophilus]|uniref:hypothetical protein n=1 Tax=Arsenicicoccus dermatophilus TaxID=1076331 RepID=UPI001F4CBB8E|nr:hypothetical protein [Arsenicicoccus dermatophilus]MCH8612700.1 hypothetical protein [Arsenicicoccus dermatophilus]
MTDLLEQQLRTDLRDAADSLPPEATRLVHPALLGPEADLDQEWGVEELPWRARLRRPLAVAASVAAAAGLTAGVVVTGPRLTEAPPAAVTPARVQQAITDLRAIERGLPRLRALEAEAEARCMAARGFPTYLPTRWGSYSLTSPVSGRRSVAEARRDGYFFALDRAGRLAEQITTEDYRRRYYEAYDPPPSPWQDRLERAHLGWLAARVVPEAGCRTHARDEVWGPDAEAGATLEGRLRGTLTDARGDNVDREDVATEGADPATLAWRRCMAADPAVLPRTVRLAPGTSLVWWLHDSLEQAWGLPDHFMGKVRPLTPQALARAASQERAVAVRDVVCSARPEARGAGEFSERFQMEFALKSAPPDTVDLLPRWRAALERVLARHR